MKRIALCLLLAACHDPVEGAWQSDEDASHASLRAVQDKLTAGQKKLWLGKGFFGKLTLVFRRGRVASVYEGQCGQTDSYATKTLPNGAVEVRATQSVALLDKGELSTSFGAGALPAIEAAREVFKRVSLEETLRRYPCLNK